jgi:hypothetical protein
MIEELATLRFLEDAINVLFIGPPGVGKTMLAVGLWAGPRSGRAIAPNTRPQPISPPSATGRHSRDAGQRPCAISPGRAFS